MHCYYCILRTADHQVADLHVLDATSDGGALAKARATVTDGQAIDEIVVYHGERRVASLRADLRPMRTAA